jgi:hypothetical protein
MYQRFFVKKTILGHTYIEVGQGKEGLNKTNIIYHCDHLIYVIVCTVITTTVMYKGEEKFQL